MAAEAGQTLLPYREDHIGLTRWPLVTAVGLTGLTTVLALVAVPTWNAPIGALTVTGFIFAGFAAAVAWVLVYTGWVLGIEINREQIRYGALRKADARARRGKPPSKSNPYATWLNEYRCPLPAVRRVWVVRGARAALDPERSTGVITSQRSQGRTVARQGWIRIPFSPGGLMLQLESPTAAPTDPQMMWRVFARVPVTSAFRDSDILYTPVSDPDRCRAALAEALRQNGMELDAQGNVQRLSNFQIGEVNPDR
jgi:hypothetical protein